MKDSEFSPEALTHILTNLTDVDRPILSQIVEQLESLSDVISFWVEDSGAETDPITTIHSPSSTIEHSAYSDANGTSWVEHYKIFRGGHGLVRSWLERFGYQSADLGLLFRARP